MGYGQHSFDKKSAWYIPKRLIQKKCMHGVWAETLRSDKAELGLGYIRRTVRARCKRTMGVRDKDRWDDKGAHRSLLSGYQSNNM